MYSQNMITILFIWFILATVAEHVLALTPASIPSLPKKVLYYLIVWPEIAVSYFKGLLSKWSFSWLIASNWFRS